MISADEQKIAYWNAATLALAEGALGDALGYISALRDVKGSDRLKEAINDVTENISTMLEPYHDGADNG